MILPRRKNLPQPFVGRLDRADQTSQLTIENNTALAKEHILCDACQQSVIASHLRDPVRGSELFRSYTDIHALEINTAENGCHLCALFLGKIRHLSPATGVITVTLHVSRSGGITLSIKSGNGEGQRLGELAIVPVEDIEDYGANVSADTKFTFPIRKTYESAQVAESLSSDASFALAREWLQQCLHRHPKCSQAAASAQKIYPSRLIDVGDGLKVPTRVVVTQELNTSELRYLTLSHCWGGADILRLLTDNVDKLMVEISMQALPKTFQDAVIITCRLGYRYIWIDSLCIIQDSPDDWRACSAVMGDIYANSICTVAALTAHNSHEGCFFDDTRNPLFFRPYRISDRWYVEGNRNVGVDLRVGLSALPLHTRAWVVQERILAPRTLYYGSNGLAWECTECSATEAVPWGDVSTFSPKASFFDIQQQSPDAIYDCWTDIQISYTRCQLTRFSDRLVAISGVVKRIEMLTGWVNVWGLWKEQLSRELLWFVEEPTRGRPEQYLAPTWSWVGIEGRVMMAIGSAEKRIWMAEVVDVGTLEGRGHVRIRGIMKRVRYTDEGRLSPRGETNARWEDVDWDSDVELAAGYFAGKELQCLLIARLADYVGEGKAMDIGLVVSPQGDEWVRLGVFRQLREGNNLFPESTVDLSEVVVI
ncbi:HET-domain-containing protein [Imleria badia]|nr:HET-domain-containing protein [Imleria badia]